jgi:hypothetical protein
MNSTNSAAPYEEGKIYLATIIDQGLARSVNRETQLLLTVRIRARLKNERNRADGAEACLEAERELRVTFAEDDEQRLRMAVRDLERLNFPGDDISLLDPEHPQHVSLLGKEVHVRMRVVADNEYWNFSWPPEALRGEELQRAAASLRDRIAAVRQRGKGGAPKQRGKEDGGPGGRPEVGQ